MKFIKSNLLLFSVLLTALVVFSVLLTFSLMTSGKIEDLKSEISDAESRIKSQRSEKMPFEGLDYELDMARKDLVRLAALERAQNRLWGQVLASENNLSKTWKKKSPESINSSLIRQYTQLRELCRSKNVVLPGGSQGGPATPFLDTPSQPAEEFGFGLKSYDGNWPNFSSEEAQLLGVQIEIIKQLVGFVSESATKDYPLRLAYIHREPVGETDEGNIGDDLLELDDRKASLLKTHGILDSTCFEIQFVGITSHARTFLNSLRPPYLLRKLVVERDTDDTSTAFSPDLGDPAFGNSSPESSELPIVQDVRSKFTFLIEYVTGVDRDAEAFFTGILENVEADDQSLRDFLEASGHGALTETLIE